MSFKIQQQLSKINNENLGISNENDINKNINQHRSPISSKEKTLRRCSFTSFDNSKIKGQINEIRTVFLKERRLINSNNVYNINNFQNSNYDNDNYNNTNSKLLAFNSRGTRLINNMNASDNNNYYYSSSKSGQFRNINYLNQYNDDDDFDKEIIVISKSPKKHLIFKNFVCNKNDIASQYFNKCHEKRVNDYMGNCTCLVNPEIYNHSNDKEYINFISDLSNYKNKTIAEWKNIDVSLL